MIARLQSKLHEFCVLCVESASIFPGWVCICPSPGSGFNTSQHPIPKGLHHPGLPRYYSTQSAAGRYVLTAAIQHSAWMAITEDVFTTYGLQDYQGILRVANALYRKNRSREAVWRVLTTNTILDDRELQETLRSQLNAVAHRLMKSWELFQEEQQRDEFRTRLSELLYDNSTAWLSLLKLRKRISVSFQWDERLFETGPSEDAVKIPGNFVQHNGVTPILFLSPAFLEDNIDGRTNLPTLVRKGNVLLKNCPFLLAALKEEQEISSPRLANKATNSRNGNESVN